MVLCSPDALEHVAWIGLRGSGIVPEIRSARRFVMIQGRTTIEMTGFLETT